MSPVKIGEITKVDSQLQSYPYYLYLLLYVFFNCIQQKYKRRFNGVLYKVIYKPATRKRWLVFCCTFAPDQQTKK